MDKQFEKETELPKEHKFTPSAKWNIAKRIHKKREIRVFVSSTFRDFRNEREEIIKKAFREVSL